MARVLIIEDDPTIRNIVRRMLTRFGHDVDEAENGREGLRAFRAQPVDLVVTDLIMPDLDGIEVVTQLRESHVELPVIAISGGGAIVPKELLLANAAALGAIEVIPKPFSTEQFMAAVDRALCVGAV